jgi:hypothetical protein
MWRQAVANFAAAGSGAKRATHDEHNVKITHPAAGVKRKQNVSMPPTENTDKGKMQMKTGLGALSVRAFLATHVDKKMENTDKGKMQMKTGLGALNVRACLATLVDKKNVIYHNKVTGKYYPKTTVSKPGTDCPNGPQSLKECFQYGDQFIDRLAAEMGTRKLAMRLLKWHWYFTSCFSGVGCAEMVITLLIRFTWLSVSNFNNSLLRFGFAQQSCVMSC